MNIKSQYDEVVTEDSTVVADKTQLDTDTQTALNGHSALNASVVANGPTAFPGPDGTIVGLTPNADGTVTTSVFKDGTLEV